MKYLRYTGEFISRGGTVWRIDIMQEADAPFETIGALDFPADAPLVLEWSREDKEKVMCGSTATLKIISPGDRTYEDLYTIEVGHILLEVYRDGKKYWSGAIDPEFYEEPYETAAGYEVSLTFSDFGILDRIKYDLTGIQTLREIALYAIARAGLSCEIDTTHVTTTFDNGGTIAGGLSIRSENFIDEDGEALTLYEVLEGIFQPLAIRMVQREGRIYLYDLNGLYTKGKAKQIDWDGDSQTMGTDRVANNVIVSFSPYSGAELLTGEIAYGGKYDVEHTNLTSSWPSGQTSEEFNDYGEYYSYYPDYDPAHRQGYNWDYNLIDFTIFLHDNGTGIKAKGPGCKYFHILPVTGGAGETSGVAYAFRTGGHGGINTGWPTWKLHSQIGKPNGGSSVMTSNRVFLPKLDDASTKKYRVRLVQEILVDARYNPLSGSSSYNDDGNDNTVKVCSGFVFIQAKITLYDADGKALYHYSNKETAQGATKGHLGYSKGKWVSGSDPGGDCYLEYYNPEDLGEDAGIRGWKANRHCIGRPDGKGGRMGTEIYDSFKKMDDGEYIPYPPVSGYLEVEILAGFYGYDYGQMVDNCDFGSNYSQWDKKGIYGLLRWVLYKAPKVDVVNNNLIFDSAELEDVEYRGYINKSAKEEISIDTICGTAARVCPTARGIYHRTTTGQQLQQLTRAGKTDHPEKLLIGTLYSQFASRKTTLSGEAVIDTGLHYYTEANQPGKRFMLMSDTQDVITDCTDAEYCEFRPDEYDSIEEV